MRVNILVNKHQNIIEINGWDNDNSLCFYKEGEEGSQGELRDAARESAELTWTVAVEFAGWYNSKQSSFKDWARIHPDLETKKAFPYWLNNIYEK